MATPRRAGVTTIDRPTRSGCRVQSHCACGEPPPWCREPSGPPAPPTCRAVALPTRADLHKPWGESTLSRAVLLSTQRRAHRCRARAPRAVLELEPTCQEQAPWRRWPRGSHAPAPASPPCSDARHPAWPPHRPASVARLQLGQTPPRTFGARQTARPLHGGRTGRAQRAATAWSSGAASRPGPSGAITSPVGRRATPEPTPSRRWNQLPSCSPTTMVSHVRAWRAALAAKWRLANALPRAGTAGRRAAEAARPDTELFDGTMGRMVPPD